MAESTTTPSDPSSRSAVHQEILVDVDRDRAFRVFTEQFDAIKPREYNLLDVEIAETVLEPRAGGDVYDRGVDGTTCRWARVLAYEPTHRLVISWDITVDWRPETDPDRTSEVEVRFLTEGPDRTRVTVDHRNLERHGEGSSTMLPGLDSGWRVMLGRYAALT